MAAILGGRSGGARDAAMAALVRTTLPRAYAGARTAPVIAEASDRPRPAVISEATRPRAEPQVDATATVASPVRAKPQPLDVAAMRPVVATTTPTTTPTSLRWSTGAQPIPVAAQAYAPVEAAVAPPPRPHPLVEPAPAAVAAAKIEARLPEMTVAKPEPAARPEIVAKAEPAPPPPAAEPHRLRASPAPVSRWVIQLGAPDDEGKAKDILEEARSRSRGVLAKASPFTEKVVRDGATLYRARFSGFDEADSANEACRSLKRNGFACFATRS